jgi:RHS repeat-associated protein
MLLIPVVMLGPVAVRQWSRIKGGIDPLASPDLKLWHRVLCVLLAYIFLVGPEAFHRLAQAETQYSQLSTLAWGRGNRIIAYQYDDNGSLTSKTTTEGQTTLEQIVYVYNLQSRLGRVETYDGSAVLLKAVEYRYNPQGIRVAKVETLGGTTIQTDYLIDSHNPTGYAQVLEETTDDGTTLTGIQYTIGDDVISQTKSTWTGSAWTANPTQYLLYDGHGSTRQLAGSNQSIQQSYSYDAYGVMLGSAPNPADSAQTNYLYAGEQYDSSVKQYYNRARCYNPSNGLFNRVDPFAGNHSDPQSLHKYLYCHANPVNNIDPLGLFTAEFGRIAHEAIQNVYAIDRPLDKGNIIYGRWTKLGYKALLAYRLKPDIMNHSGYHNRNQKTWLEIKPLSLAGVADAMASYRNYFEQFKPFDYSPEASWVPSTNYVLAGQVPIFFFNAGGIIFYTDITENTDELLKLGSVAVVAQFIRSAAGKQFTQSIVNSGSQVQKLVRVRTVADKERLKEYTKIAAMLTLVGCLI